MQIFQNLETAACLGRTFRKPLMVMKLAFILMLVFTLHAGAHSYGQRVSLHYDGQDMKAVILDLQRQTGYNFAFKGSVLKKTRPVKISLDSIELRDALAALEGLQPVQFSIVAGTVIMNERPAQVGAVEGVSPIPSDTTVDRSYVLRGVVLGIADAPLQDVTIQNERSGRGTLTAPSGEFLMRDIALGDVLTMSYVGYTPRRVTVRELKYMEVKLEPATTELDAVQVEGYRVNSKRMSTSNVVTIRAKDIEKQPIANPLQALQGRVPGLVVTATSGDRRSGWDVLLRGRTSIDRSANQGPLYIVDGIPITILTLQSSRTSTSEQQGFDQSGINPPGGPSSGQSPIYSINPDDIESISILKDPDALAVYGSRGGNGVVLITTKKGQPGKTKLDISFSSGLSFISKFYDMLSTPEYVSMRKEALKNDNEIPTPSNAYDLLVWDTAQYSNWQKVFWGGIGNNVDLNLSLSGGDKMTSFRISGTYSYFTPLNNFKGSDQRLTNMININHASLNRKLKVGFTNYFSLAKATMIQLTGSALLAPNAPPIFDSEGKLNYQGWRPADDRFDFGRILNPFSANTTFINSQFNVSYNLLKGLNISGNFGYSQNHQDVISVTTIASQNPQYNRRGSSQVGTSKGSRIVIEPQLEYRTFIGKGDLNIMVGGTYQNTTQKGAATFGSGFVNDALLRSIENAPVSFGNNLEGQYKYAAVFGRITYNYNKKYLLNLTGRRDGSSRFADGRNFGNFYAVGLGYIISEEPFIKHKLPFVSLGKVRASYGLTGSDNIGDYQYITRWARSSSSIATYDNSPIYISQQHANPLLQWQVDRKLDVGLELGLFNDRLNFNFGWYRNRVGNQLVTYILPGMTGFPNVTANFPALVQNKGVEIMANLRLVESKTVSWGLNFNAGVNRNKLKEYPGIESSPYRSLYEVGQPLSIVKVLHYTGVDPQTGYSSFEDRNKDGKIESDPTYSLDPNTDLYTLDISVRSDGGFGSDFRFNNFNLSFFFQYRLRDGKNAYVTSPAPGTIANISRKLYENRWRNPGDKARFPRLTTTNHESYRNFAQSDGTYTNADFMRLNNLALSYQFSDIVCKKLKLRSLIAFLRGQNLFVITGYEGADPEVLSFGGFPPISTVTFGVKASL